MLHRTQLMATVRSTAPLPARKTRAASKLEDQLVILPTRDNLEEQTIGVDKTTREESVNKVIEINLEAGKKTVEGIDKEEIETKVDTGNNLEAEINKEEIENNLAIETSKVEIGTNPGIGSKLIIGNKGEAQGREETKIMQFQTRANTEMQRIVQEAPCLPASTDVQPTLVPG